MVFTPENAPPAEYGEPGSASTIEKDQLGRLHRTSSPSSAPPGGVEVAGRLLTPTIDSRIYDSQQVQSTLKRAESGWFGDQLTMFRRMLENDAHLWSVVQTRRLTLQQSGFSIVPPAGEDENPRAHAAAAYVEFLLSKMIGWPEAIGTLAGGGIRGFEALEIIWDGTVPIALMDTPDDGWRWQKGLQYRNANGRWFDVPPDKFVIVSPRGHSPVLARRGAMRACCVAWVIKHYGLRDWAAFVELFGIPHRFLRYPEAMNADDGALSSAITSLQSMGASGVGAIRKDLELELVGGAASKGGAASPHESIVRFCDAQFSKAILGQTLTADASQSTGTYATARIHQEVRMDISRADGEEVGSALRNDLFAPAVGYALGWDTPIPEIVFELDDPVDAKEIAEMLGVVVGELGLPIARRDVYELLRLSPPAEGDELLEVPTAREAGLELDGGGGFRDGRRPEAHAREYTGPVGEVPIALEALAQLGADDWEEVERQTVSEAVARIIRSNPEISPQQLEYELRMLYPSLDVDTFAEHVTGFTTAAAANGANEVHLVEGDGGEEAEEEGES